MHIMSQLETAIPETSPLPEASPHEPHERTPAGEPPAHPATGFEILTEIACTINSVLDLDKLYWVIYEQCSRVLETENFWIGRYTDGDTVQAVLWFYQGEQIVPHGKTLPIEPGLNTEVLRTRRLLRVSDYIAAKKERGLLPPDYPASEVPQAWIGVPMLIGDRLIGIIANSRTRPFSADDARLLEAIAGLCAVAIENAGLVQLVSETAQDLLRTTQELSDLNKVASAVNRSLDLPTVLAQGADMLLRVTGWDMATVCLRGPGDQWEVALHRYAGGTNAPPEAAGQSAPGGDISDAASPLRAFITQALANARPVAVDVATLSDDEVAALQRYLDEGIHRLVIFPLRAGAAGALRLATRQAGEPPVLGLLLLGSRAGASGKVTAEMLRDTTLLAIGEQLATAVQNARLLDDVQTARSHLEAVLESTADGVLFYNNDLRVELGNQAVHEQYSLPPGALLGKTPEEVADLVAGAFTDPAQPRSFIDRFRSAPPDAMYAEECVLSRPRPRVVQRTVRPVRDDSGAILGRLVVYHDITEAKDLERRTRELAGINAVATALNRSLDLNTMLELAAGAVLDVTGWDTVAVRLWNPLTRTWDLVLCRGPESPGAGPTNWRIPQDNQVYGPITPELLAGRPRAFELNDQPPDTAVPAGDEPAARSRAARGRGDAAGSRRRAGHETRIALPIQVHAQTLGMLELGILRPIREAEVQARLEDATLRGICEQLALAIENSRLYAEARQVAALEERQHLARELHDSVTQSLFTVTLMAEAAQAMVERDPSRVGSYLDKLKSTAGTALNEMRALLAQLRPTALGASGLGPALRRHAETVGQQLALPIEVEVDPDLGSLPTAVEDALFRIAQEALHNVVKHAQAQQARVCLTRAGAMDGNRGPGVVLTVEDDGQGFEPSRAAGGTGGRGLGLTGMRERASALGGHLTVESAPGHGSRIIVAVPLTGANAG
jgi:signal transduction histidine kinase/PAS domain-containing protein